MSSTETTLYDDANNKPAFPLPPELRLTIYKQLLIHPDRPLKPNGPFRSVCGRPIYEESYLENDHIFTSVLRVCRLFYSEALPILYGCNVLHFHDTELTKPVLPFPEEYLTMVKRVKVDMRPYLYNSTRTMAQFLRALSGPGISLLDLSVRVRVSRRADVYWRRIPKGDPPPLDTDCFLSAENPMFAALLSFRAVKRFCIELLDEARFEPGVADAFRESFMEYGTI